MLTNKPALETKINKIWLPLGSALFVLTLAYFTLLLISGISFPSAITVSLVLGSQAVLGASIISALTGHPSPSVTLIGYSIVLGAALFLVIMLTVLTLGLTVTQGFVVFLGITLFLSTIAFLRVTDRAENKARIRNLKALALLVLPITLGSLSFIPFWRSNPIKIEGWTALYGDIFYHETLSNSLARASTMNLAALDQAIRYHWLGDAWAGLVSSVAQLAPFESLTRVLLIWSLVASVFLAAALGKFIHNSLTSSLFSATYLVVAAPVGAGLGLTYTFIIAEWSPTHIFAIPFAFALTLLSFRYVDQRDFNQFEFRLFLPFALICLSALLALSRIPFTMVTLASTFGLLVMSSRDKSKLSLVIKLMVYLTTGAVLSWLLFIRGGPGNSLYLALNTEVSGMMGLVPIGSTFGQLLSVPALFAVYSLSAMGVVPLLAFGTAKHKAAGIWAITALISAVLFSTLLSQDGGSEITFLWAASAIALPISASGLALALHRTNSLYTNAMRRRLTWAACSLIGVSLGILYIQTTDLISSFRFAGLFRWAIPISLLAISVLVMLISIGRARYRNSQSQPSKLFALTLIITLSIPIGTSTAALASRLSHENPAADSVTPLAITSSDIAAGEWVQENTPENAIIATTRQCGSIAETPGQCGSMLLGPSALGSRQTLIEGHSYSVGEGELPEPWLTYSLDSAAVAVHPSMSTLCKLRTTGVDWLWVDLLTLSDSSTQLQTLDTLGVRGFLNDRIGIYDLRNVSCEQPLNEQ